MKTRVFLFLVWFFMASSACAQEEVKMSLSIGGAVEKAFANNKGLQIQAKEIDVARAGILSAQGAFLPTVGGGAGYARNDFVLSLPGLAITKKDPNILTGYRDDNAAAVGVKKVVYNGGKKERQLDQARTQLKIQEQTLRLQKQLLAFEVKRLYYGLLLAQETKTIVQTFADVSEAHYEDVNKKFAEGTVSKFDVLQSKVRVSEWTPELIRAQNASEVISAEFKKVLGSKQEEVFLLSDRLDVSPVNFNEAEVLSQAQLSNPELILQSYGVDAAKISIEFAKGWDRPEVTAAAGVNFRSNNVANMFNSRHENWSAGVSIDVPIFDGFFAKSKVEEAQARYAEAMLTKENAVDQIAVEVKRGVADLRKAEALIDSQKMNLEEAKEAVRLAQVRYDNGEGTNLDVLESQGAFSRAQKTFFEGVYDYLMAQAYLIKLLGGDLIQHQ
jgi:outer membrane protein